MPSKRELMYEKAIGTTYEKLYAPPSLPDLGAAAEALGGTIVEGRIHAETPNGPIVLSLTPNSAEGFYLYRYSGPLGEDKAFIRQKLKLTVSSPDLHAEIERGKSAARIWAECHKPNGSLVETYLASRGLRLP